MEWFESGHQPDSSLSPEEREKDFLGRVASRQVVSTRCRSLFAGTEHHLFHVGSRVLVAMPYCSTRVASCCSYLSKILHHFFAKSIIEREEREDYAYHTVQYRDTVLYF